MSEQQPPTIPGVLWALAGLVFKREALLVASACAVLLAAGGGAVAWAQSKLDGGVAPLAAKLEAHERASAQTHHEQSLAGEELRRRMAAVERTTYETALNVRLLLEAQRIQPVTLDLPTPGQRDGGR